MASGIRIGVIGDFNQNNLTHLATNTGIQHAAEALDRNFEVVWLSTDESHEYARFAGLLCSPGSPYGSLDGALAGIRYARENGVPFLGTCGGFQHLVLEYARNMLGVSDADHAETNPYASRLFITPLSCSLKGKVMEVQIRPGTHAAGAYGTSHSSERYYCDFGLNPEYTAQLEAAGLKVTGSDADGEVRIMEVEGHRFCMGTLFVPQASSAEGKPHPLVLAFCRAAMQPR
jgi:CTP synthase (UTP-ammonia lyase)